MHRQFTLALAGVLLLTSGAWAAIGQAQGFEIGALNAVMWPGGVGSAEGSHQVMFGQEQGATSLWPPTAGQQKETGVFTQVAVAGGGGPATIVQTAAAVGGQGQTGGGWPHATNAQGQGMGVDFTTAIVKPYGPGSATAAQSFVGGQTQVLMTPTTLSTQAQVVGVAEYASVVGGPSADPTVTNAIRVDLCQGQMTTVPCPPHWGQ